MSTITMESSNRASSVILNHQTRFEDDPVSVVVEIMFGQDEKAIRTVRQHWAICIHRDPEETEGWLTGEVIGIPGVVSQGRNRQETLTNLKEALECALEELRSTNTPVELRREFDIPDGGEIIYLVF